MPFMRCFALWLLRLQIANFCLYFVCPCIAIQDSAYYYAVDRAVCVNVDCLRRSICIESLVRCLAAIESVLYLHVLAKLLL